jgi:hypothetical protein
MDNTPYYGNNLDIVYCKEVNFPVYISNILLSGKSALESMVLGRAAPGEQALGEPKADH